MEARDRNQSPSSLSCSPKKATTRYSCPRIPASAAQYGRKRWTAWPLADLYRGLLDQIELEDMTVIGNSVGGWIAVEMGLLVSSRIGGIVLLDAVGIQVEGHPVAGVSGLSMPEIQALSFHDPTPYRVDLATIPDAQKALMAANGAALAVYAGSPAMADPTLLGRLDDLAIPTLVSWGESDQIVDPGYGQAYAAAIRGARFEVLPRTGHMPQMESPELVLQAI
jgi:pimeloyl-ACP methyl ester carboxylesterase